MPHNKIIRKARDFQWKKEALLKSIELCLFLWFKKKKPEVCSSGNSYPNHVSLYSFFIAPWNILISEGVTGEAPPVKKIIIKSKYFFVLFLMKKRGTVNPFGQYMYIIKMLSHRQPLGKL